MKIVALAVLLGFSGSVVAQSPAPGAADDAIALDVQKRMQSIIETSMARATKSFPESLEYLEGEARKLRGEFPERSEPFELLMAAATFSDAAKARSLAQEIVNNKIATTQLKASARGLINNLNAVGKPFVLRFNASDGGAVDLESFKGKVVLIDFWATWCPPCVAMLPHLKTTYDQLRPSGFEIVGISYDNDRQTLAAFVKRQHIPWPQYFDEKGRENELAKRFDVQALPTMWLVDRRGILRYLNAGNDLEGKVKKLLAE